MKANNLQTRAAKHKASIANKLILVFAVAVIFLLLEFLLFFILNQNFVKGLSKTYQIEQTLINVQQGKDALQNLAELFEVKTANKITMVKSNQRLHIARRKALDKLFIELDSKLKNDPELKEEFTRAEDLITQIEDLIQDTYKKVKSSESSQQSVEEVEENLLFIGQFKIQCNESLERITIQLSKRLHDSFRKVYNTRTIPVIIGVLLFIVLAILLILFGIVLTKQITAPIQSLMQATEAVAKGELTHKLPEFPDDELGKLALSFNKMIEELSLSRNELVAEKLHSEKIVKSLLNSLIILKPDWSIKNVNQATVDLLGYREEELTRQSFTLIFEEEYGKNIILTKDQIIKEGSVKNLEKTYKTKDRRNIPILFSASVLLDSKGNIEEIICVAQDITERKVIEQKEKELAAKDALADAERKKSLELQSINEQLQKAYKELELHQKELKETHEQLLQASRMTAMGEIAAGVAHELTQPLLGIKGFAAALLEDIKSYLENKEQAAKPLEQVIKDITDDLDIILKQTDRMATIVDNVRNFARGGEAGFVPLNLRKTIDDAFMLFSEQLKNYRIKIVNNLPEGLPKIMGNNSQLQQVFINLLANSRDAINAKGKDGGQLTLNYKLSDDKKQINIEFSDDGGGMPGEVMQKIFEPFFTTKPTGKGTGLGMAIVRKIIDAHHGTIDVRSEVGAGTTITISFTLVEDS